MSYDKIISHKIQKLYFKHESYDNNTNGTRLINDIAIFRLNQEVQLNREIQIACLPRVHSTSYPPENTPARVAG